MEHLAAAVGVVVPYSPVKGATIALYRSPAPLGIHRSIGVPPTAESIKPNGTEGPSFRAKSRAVNQQVAENVFQLLAGKAAVDGACHGSSKGPAVSFRGTLE